MIGPDKSLFLMKEVNLHGLSQQYLSAIQANLLTLSEIMIHYKVSCESASRQPNRYYNFLTLGTLVLSLIKGVNIG